MSRSNQPRRDLTAPAVVHAVRTEFCFSGAAFDVRRGRRRQSLSNGRLVLGLGNSGPQVIKGWHGIRFDRPLQRLREIVEIPNRGHALTIDSGWQEVAETALGFVKRYA